MTGAEDQEPVLDVVVPASLHGQRVDRSVAMLTGLARSTVSELVGAGKVEVDGRVVTTRSAPLVAGQRLLARLPAPTDSRPRPDPSVTFNVVYEDSDLIVVDKPAGLVVHHGAGHHSGTLVDGLLARFPELSELPEAGIGEPDRPGIVHRLDKNTSGLLVVARSPEAFDSLSEQLREHSPDRRYLALVAGSVEAPEGVVDAPIGRSTRQPDRMAVSSRGRPARTRYTVEARYGQPVASTLVEAALETGRTHQVRVHLAAIGHPVVGDDRYGADRARPEALLNALGRDRLFLHAWRLEVEHVDGRHMSWESPLPDDLATMLAALS
ncbi:MAG: RluA family pseudouridine synthase [Acidimicrobiales bacterium]